MPEGSYTRSLLRPTVERVYTAIRSALKSGYSSMVATHSLSESSFVDQLNVDDSPLKNRRLSGAWSNQAPGTELVVIDESWRVSKDR